MKTIADAVGRIQKTLNTHKLKSALARMDATLARADADFKEGDHPRDADGKFAAKAEISGPAAHGVEAYKKALKPGATMKPQGLIKHMIKSGQYSEKDIWEAAKDTFDLSDDKKKWVRHSYYKLKHESGDKENFPPLPKESTVSVKPKAITVSEAIKDKYVPENNWHEGAKAWDSAPPEILAAISKTQKLTTVITSKRNAFYSPSTHGINMNYKINPDNREAVAVWRHEFGHAIDYNGNRRGQSASCTPMMLADVNWRFPEKQNKIAALWKECMDRKTAEDPDFRKSEGLMLSDFVCALTNRKLAYGHTKAYFARPGAREAEMFANYVALISTKDGGEYRKLLYEIAPESCKAFDDIIKKSGS